MRSRFAQLVYFIAFLFCFVVTERIIVAQTVLDACQFAGSNAGEQISTAIANLPSTGGTVDCRCYSGDNNEFNSPLIINKPVTLLFGHANFFVRDTIRINLPDHGNWKRAVKILGAGVGSTRFQGASGKPTLLVGGADSVLQVGFTISDIEFAGTVGFANGDAIQLIRARDSVLERLRITGYLTLGTDAIRVGSSSMFNTIRDVRIDNVNQGVEIAGGQDDDQANRNIVSNCVIAQVQAGAAVRIGPYAYVNVIQNCNFEGNVGQTDVLIEGITEGTRILDSHFEGLGATRLYGVTVSALGGLRPRDIVLQGLHIADYKDWAIVIMDSDSVKISNTHFNGRAGNSGAVTVFNSTDGIGMGWSRGNAPTLLSVNSSTFQLWPSVP